MDGFDREVDSNSEPVVRELRTLLLEQLAAAIDPREGRRRGDSGLNEIAGSALALLCERPADEVVVSVSNPTGTRESRTTLEVVVSDGPFIVDTLRLALRRLGLRELVFVHPLIHIERTQGGAIHRVGKLTTSSRESYLYCEVPRIVDDERREAIRDELARTFGELRRVVVDHTRMVHALRRHTADLGFRPGEVGRARRLAGFLEWLGEDNFVFLGYRRYRVRRELGDWSIERDPGSGLGMLAEPAHSRFAESQHGEALPDIMRSRLADERLVFFDKSRSESIIHRAGRLDSISIKMIDSSGEVCGFGKILGLLTHQAVRTPGSEIPLLRERRGDVVELLRVDIGSHDHKSALNAFDSLPVEFLFSFEVEDIARAVRRIMNAAHSGRVEVFAVPDPFHRSFFVSVIMPRSNYEETLHEEVRALLARRFGATYVDSRSSFVDDVSALLHFFCSSGRDIDPQVLPELERSVQARAESWDDRFERALLDEAPPERAYELLDVWAGALPHDYRLATPAPEAVRDVLALEELNRGEIPVEMAVFDDPVGEANTSRLKVYLTARPFLTDLLPVIDHFGVQVVDATLTEIPGAGRRACWIVTFRIVRVAQDESLLHETRRRVLDGLRAVLTRRAEDDSLNRLVLGAGLEWRQVEIVRAYLAYRAQLGRSLDRRQASDVLLAHPAATRALVQLFHARFDPDLERPREAAQSEAEHRLAAEREAIRTSAADRVFGGIASLIRATSRTNYFAPSAVEFGALAFKVDPASLERSAPPVPFAEIFVYASDMLGVHLRGGPLARGGIRWSDRVQDLRTEVLELWKTQRVKNGLIVPAGAKGGFALRRRAASEDVARAEARKQYGRFMRLLLSLTDNVVRGEVVAPERVIRHDSDDPYLVVAPDRGTAKLSDVANDVAADREFWLADAFASGGSDGFDHKEEGITARGAWACVQRHFAELDIDIERGAFTVVGIGDMSGDVFGNGMLLMRSARLVAAFDHSHIFLDPDPDAERSWRERRRLFELERSSWEDYDRGSVSRGGGVWKRSAREIRLSPEVRELLGVREAVLSGEDVVRAVLRLRVDLLWNGGVGTYVKASWEPDRDVGDRANTAVRVNADELRARVVAEGGNLGFTQAARVEFALAGGAINSDAIDNSAGVDLSDHEVNFKVLLRAGASDVEMSNEERRPWLRACLESVRHAVLAHSAAQSGAISMDLDRSREDPERMLRVAAYLSRKAALDWRVEGLPDRDRLRARTSAAGEPQGYTRPELAVLLGYTKMLVKRTLIASELPDHPVLEEVLASYFPEPLRGRFAEAIAVHPLRREIVATAVCNRVVDAAGVTLVPELTQETGSSIPEVLAATWAAEELLEAVRLREAIEQEPIRASARVHARLWLEGAVRDGARSRLGLERRAAPTRDEMSQWMTLARSLRGLLPTCLGATELTRVEESRRDLAERGLSDKLARELAALPSLVRWFSAISLAARTGAPLQRVARLYARVGEETRIAWLLDRLTNADRRDGWDSLACDALAIDMLEAQRLVTDRVLRSRISEDAPQLFDESRRAQLMRIAETVGQLDTESRASLAPLLLVSRQIRRLC